MSSFAERVTLITGAGSGLGRALAKRLAAEGAAIAAIDLTPGPLASLADELPAKRIAWSAADVTDRAALHSALVELQEQLGAVDLLIASAGIGRETSALHFQAAEIEEIVRVNLIGVANAIEAVLPGMVERMRGHIVGISSLAAYRGLPRMAGYCASKAGLNAMLDALRMELMPLGIAVTTICPGWIRTPLTANLDVPMPNLLEVAPAADLIVEAIRRRRAFYAFPAAPARRLRLLRWLPATWSDWLAARALRSLRKS